MEPLEFNIYGIVACDCRGLDMISVAPSIPMCGDVFYVQSI